MLKIDGIREIKDWVPALKYEAYNGYFDLYGLGETEEEAKLDFRIRATSEYYRCQDFIEAYEKEAKACDHCGTLKNADDMIDGYCSEECKFHDEAGAQRTN